MRLSRLPERWRSLLQDLIDVAHASLKDAWLKGRKKEGSYGKDDSGSRPRPGSHIDGLQPFVHYQRLLKAALFIRSMTSNPVLPGELFKDTRFPQPSQNIDLPRASKLLTSLEAALLITAPVNSRYFSFDVAIKCILAQRLKKWYRDRAARDGVNLPLCVRRLLRRGYLRGRGALRTRCCLEEPWWAQSLVAMVYLSKLQHDKKAAATGVAFLSLPAAVVSTHIKRWGNLDVSERFMHDFFGCLLSYESTVPRLRMFLCFLGASKIVGGAVDQESLSLLSTDCALSMYLELVCCIRAETLARRPEDTDSSVLFPSSGTDETTRTDRWLEDKELLASATLRWAQCVRACPAHWFAQHLDGEQGAVDVDDHLWQVMMQWCHAMKVFTKVAGEKLGWLERQGKPGKDAGVVMLHKVSF